MNHYEYLWILFKCTYDALLPIVLLQSIMDIMTCFHGNNN